MHKDEAARGALCDYPHEIGTTPKNLSAILRRAADQFPEHGVVYIGSDGTEELQTYPALVKEAERILAGLRGLGLKAQDKVIFQLDHQRSFIPAFWGCVLGGIVPLPIPLPPAHDYANSGVSRIYGVWQLLDHPIILTTKVHADSVLSVSKLFDMPDLHVETLESLINNQGDETWHEAKPLDLALLMLTSGSTGLPKAVRLTHLNLLASSAGWCRGKWAFPRGRLVELDGPRSCCRDHFSRHGRFLGLPTDSSPGTADIGRPSKVAGLD